LDLIGLKYIPVINSNIPNAANKAVCPPNNAFYQAINSLKKKPPRSM